MHKKIAQLIKKMVDETSYTHFSCDVIAPERNTGGFWKCQVHFKSRDDAHAHALIEAIPLIGMVYGESLNVVDKGDIIEVD